jgi:hypothetical protein
MAECAHEGPILIIGGGMADGNAVWSAAGRLQRPTHADQRRTGNAVSAAPLSKTYPRSEESVVGWYVKPPAGRRTTRSSAPGVISLAGHNDVQNILVPVQIHALTEEAPALIVRQTRVAQLVCGVKRIRGG